MCSCAAVYGALLVCSAMCLNVAPHPSLYALALSCWQVEEIALMFITFVRGDGRRLYYPNTKLVSEGIINISRCGFVRRGSTSGRVTKWG